LAYNQANGITPRGVQRGVQASLHTYDGTGREDEAAVAESADDVAAVIAELEDEMQVAANKLEFERAALLRDQINALKSGDYKKLGAKSAAYGRKSKPKAKKK
jgi:excinuclease ABC subunit B